MAAFKTAIILAAISLASMVTAAPVLKIVGSSAAEKLMGDVIPKFKTYPLSYAPDGSGAGQDYVTGGKGPLGFSDVPFKAPVKNVLTVPIGVSSIAVYAQVGGKQVVLSGKALCAIFQGKVTNWKQVGAAYPSLAVTPVVRMDSSGSTAVFTAYLASACGATWGLGSGKDIKWPAGVAKGDGTGGVMDKISQINGAVGYAVCGRTAKNVLEAKLVNKAGTALTCGTASYSTAKFRTPAGGAAGNWGPVVTVNGAGKKDFPATFILYAHIPANVTNYGAAGKGAKAFVTYLLSPGAAATLKKYGFFQVKLLSIIGNAGIKSVKA